MQNSSISYNYRSASARPAAPAERPPVGVVGLAGWTMSVLAVAGLLYVQPSAGVLAALVGSVAWWLRRHRVPLEHEARALYTRSSSRPATPADTADPAPISVSSQE